MYDNSIHSSVIQPRMNWPRRGPFLGNGRWIDLANRDAANEIGLNGRLRFDLSKADGTPRKLLDSSLLQSMGWRPRTSLEDGLRKAYAWYLQNVA